jgi:hypothetical protein
MTGLPIEPNFDFDSYTEVVQALIDQHKLIEVAEVEDGDDDFITVTLFRIEAGTQLQDVKASDFAEENVEACYRFDGSLDGNAIREAMDYFYDEMNRP